MSGAQNLNIQEAIKNSIFQRAGFDALKNLLIKKGLITESEFEDEYQNVIKNDFLNITKEMYDFDLGPYFEEFKNEDV